jgi:hypothetical protein
VLLTISAETIQAFYLPSQELTHQPQKPISFPMGPSSPHRVIFTVSGATRNVELCQRWYPYPKLRAFDDEIQASVAKIYRINRVKRGWVGMGVMRHAPIVDSSTHNGNTMNNAKLLNLIRERPLGLRLTHGRSGCKKLHNQTHESVLYGGMFDNRRPPFGRNSD